MTTTGVLFYPFHLCHEYTLHQLLARFTQVHFRDYMALQVSAFFGTTAFPDRMGDSYPDLLAQGRLVQGHSVSGHPSEQTIAAVNRDLSDAAWRDIFHHALQNPRFQHGLFGTVGQEAPPWTSLTDDWFRLYPFTGTGISHMSQTHRTGKDADLFDYGLAMLKSSAALVYSSQLALQHQLAAANRFACAFHVIRPHTHA